MLAHAALAARRMARPDATARLADLVEDLMRRQTRLTDLCQVAARRVRCPDRTSLRPGTHLAPSKPGGGQRPESRDSPDGQP